MKNSIITTLLSRRSTPIKDIGGDAPSADHIQTILAAASRVPDHNKLAPWWFVVFEGEARVKFGAVLSAAFARENPDAAPAKLELESERFTRAPLVIAVISRIKRGKAPAWEQMLSSGAACYNLCLAANALGYATNWLTEWPAYNEDVRKALGCDDRDNIAGFVYIGQQLQKPEDRPRPVLSDIVTPWVDGYAPHKGEAHEKADLSLPIAGFRLCSDK